jgi:hypothetical protein
MGDAKRKTQAVILRFSVNSIYEPERFNRPEFFP